jgi:hypothetical protein
MASRFQRRTWIKVAVRSIFVVRRYATLVVAKEGRPVVASAAGSSSLLISRIADWLQTAYSVEFEACENSCWERDGKFKAFHTFL